MRRLTSAATLVGLVLALAGSARADFVQTFSSGFANGVVIPDNNLSGWVDSRTVNTAGNSISSLSVTLHLNGDWNGDLYAYLAHDNGFTVLLNRVGRGTGNTLGYDDSGMNAVFSAAEGLGDIHKYGGTSVPTGDYAPDGRAISPLAPVETFDTAGRAALLNSFTGLNPNGGWTLFVADVSGGAQSTVASWGLDIGVASVPEPGSLAGGAVAVLFLGGVIGFYRLKAAIPLGLRELPRALGRNPFGILCNLLIRNGLIRDSLRRLLRGRPPERRIFLA